MDQPIEKNIQHVRISHRPIPLVIKRRERASDASKTKMQPASSRLDALTSRAPPFTTLCHQPSILSRSSRFLPSSIGAFHRLESIRTNVSRCNCTKALKLIMKIARAVHQQPNRDNRNDPYASSLVSVCAFKLSRDLRYLRSQQSDFCC